MHKISRTRGKASAQKEKSGSLGKALDVLDAVLNPPQTPTAAQISSSLELPRPTANRIIGNLISLGFLKRDPYRRDLMEGDRLLRLALAVVSRAAQRGPRHDILVELARATEETCNVGLITGGRVQYVDRVEAKWPLSLRLEPGSELPLHCSAIGKLLLGHLPEGQRDKYLQTIQLRRFTEKTITDVAVLKAELERVAEDGVAFDDEEYLTGVVGMAVPVLRKDRHPMLGLAVAAPSARVDVSGLRRDLPQVREAAEKLALCYENV